MSTQPNRPIVYSLEQIRSYDILWGWRGSLIATADVAEFFLGNENQVFDGFLATPTAPASLVINLTSGMILAPAPVDALIYGSLNADTDTIMQIGYAPASQVTLSTAGLVSGQSRWALIECSFTQPDSIPSDDPNAGVVPYVNTADPTDPYEGSGNDGIPQDTRRSGVAITQIIYGPAATTGSAAPPAPTSGWSPMWLIELTYGQTTITSGQILLAGPTAYSGYQNAPFCPGLTGTIPGGTGSHHGGIAGQANKIVLTNALEIQGIMPYGNLPVTNTSPNGVGGIITSPQEIPVLGICNANPNGQIAGNVGDEIFSTLTNQMFICTTSGTATTAVWTANGYGGISYYVNAFPYNNLSGGNNYYLGDTSAGAGTINLPTAISMGGTGASIVNIGTNPLTITPQSSEKINNLANGTPIVLLPGNGITLISRSGIGWYTLTPKLQWNLVAVNNSFTANQPSGSLYQSSLTANSICTLPASPADGTAQSFQILSSSGSFSLTFNTTGSDTITAGGVINNTGSTNNNPFFIPSWRSGVCDMFASAGGWVVK